MWSRLVISVGLLAFLAAPASANPVNSDPTGHVFAFTFAIIAAVCIAIETSLLRIACRVFHGADCDVIMTVSLVVLNILTLIGVLVPVLRASGSIVLAESTVVLVESIAIWKIFTFNGIELTFRRAVGYAAAVNLISYGIGLVTQ